MTDPLSEEAFALHLLEGLEAKLVKLPMEKVYAHKQNYLSERSKRLQAEKEVEEYRKKCIASFKETQRALEIQVDIQKKADEYNSNFLPAIQLQKVMLDHIKELYNRLGYPDHEAIYHTLVGSHQYESLSCYMQQPQVIELFFGPGVRSAKAEQENQKK